MAEKRIQRKRRGRKLTEAEADRYDEARRDIEQEFPPGRRGVEHADPASRMKLGDFYEIQHVMALLRAERERQGLSLADLQEATGIDRGTLCKMETGRHPNPTIGTLARCARALGKRIAVGLVEPEAAEAKA